MPLTFPAHQVPGLGAKLARPAWFDGTVLVVASAAPDLNAAFSPYDTSFRSHGMSGLILFSVPFSVIYVTILRRWCADGLFGSLPDMGPLRIRSYRVLGKRSPHPLITLISASLGAGSHLIIDAFTHSGRWGADALEWNDHLFSFGGRDFTTARVWQYIGHSLGSFVGILLFAFIASRGPLERWYGAEVVAEARTRPVRPKALERTVSTICLGQIPGLVWMVLVTNKAGIFVAGLCLAVSLLVAGRLNRAASSVA